MKDINPGRQFRMPAVDIAAKRNFTPLKRLKLSQSGCLFFLTAVALLFTFILFADIIEAWIILLFAAIIVLAGNYGFKHRVSPPCAWIAALGMGALIGSIMLLIGIQSSWLYWLMFFFLILFGLIRVNRYSGSWFDFHTLSSNAIHQGCLIGFFRPFNDEYSTYTQNLIVPILKGYGYVYYVSDKNLENTPFDGLFGKEYKNLPGLAGGYKFSNEEWQEKVNEIINKIDIAVVDISSPNVNLFWELSKCYEKLPFHRVITVMNAHAIEEEKREEYFRKFYALLEKEGVDRKLHPSVLIFLPTPEGQIWLTAAIHNKMVEITKKG